MEILAAQIRDMNPHDRAKKLSTWAYQHMRNTNTNPELVQELKKDAGDEIVVEKAPYIFILP